MPRTKVLIVEDDRSIAEALRYNLDQAGYEVLICHDGRDGVDQARLRLPDIVLLDIMLPGLDGIEVCRRLRANPETQKMLIIMLTAKSEESDQLVGFNVGADDYVVKPFSVKILMERIKALHRRRQTSASGDVISEGGITIDRIKHRVNVGDRSVELTPSEFRLLDTLIRQPGRAFDRVELIDVALGADTLVLERTIDVHIRSLRKKLGEVADRIETVRGIGYRFNEAVSTEPIS
ncbi:MAG TPA: response regulator [Pirellulaceae bacterium]|nr:response regulator [Pirellulaceae bacterium]HMO92028.1 response regulator [Pirellulaceae bacterium]HMP68827.1 response regulator [Pirellulaceae bacterium]